MHQPESQKKRAAARLCTSLEKKLSSYAAVASAAGVGVLACSLPAQGKVVSTVNWIQIVPGGTATLDLNNDGIPDFYFSNPIAFVSTQSRRLSGTLNVLPQSKNNAIWGTGGSASALGSGVTIGASGKLRPGNALMGKAAFYAWAYYASYGSAGPWKLVTRGYLGFQFRIQGEVHYGWARVNVAATNKGMYAAVNEYAYETVANKPIVTGDTGGGARSRRKQRGGSGLMKSAPSPQGSLGNLAAGAAGASSRQKPDAGRE
jgi:hypothetical protein